MEWFSKVQDYLTNLNIYTTNIDAGDIFEILILAFLLYYVLAWMKNTRAWSLLKGLIVIGGFLAIAYIFKMSTILWLANNVLSFAVIALLIVIQPELRRALEELGKKNILGSIMSLDSFKGEENVSMERTINEIVRGCVEMGKNKTGALIVIEQKDSLRDLERTGIDVDGLVSSQLLINIFEKNTPLHDGAIIIRRNRITSATCYLPLSDNNSISKELGTRHRAALGVSESSDCLTVIVSEETGHISVAQAGKIERNYDGEGLRQRLQEALANEEESGTKRRVGRRKTK